MEQLELISISSQESEDLHSQQDGQESKPSLSAKSKNTLNESSEKTSLEFGYSKTFGHSQQLNFASLGSLPEDIRASLSPKLGSAEEQKTTVTSGLRCSELSDHQGQFGCFVKMLLVTSRWVSTKSSLIWKVKNTPSSRLLFQLRPSMRDTEETASGLLLSTPTSSMRVRSKRFQHGAPTLAEFVMYPTPLADDAKNVNPKPNRIPGLVAKVKEMEKMFPTPTASDASTHWNDKKRFDSLTAKINREKKDPTGQLNPEFVEWLMGYPIEWTDLKDSETQSSLKSHTRSSEP